jgi:hypothetical protein
MTVHDYYRRALFLPLAVPVLATPLLLMGEGAASVAVMLQYQVLIGGIPYLLFAGAFLLWSRGRSDRQVRGAILLSPCVFAGMIVVLCLCLAVVAGAMWLSMMLILMAYVLGLGYGYVALAELGRLLLRPRNEPSEPLPAG